MLKSTVSLLILLCILLAGIAPGAVAQGDIYGRIVDADSGTPVKGAVVSATWYTYRTRVSIEPERRFLHHVEILTDDHGRFSIPRKEAGLFKDISVQISVFKSGYGVLFLMDLGKNFKRDHPLSEKVRWQNGTAIIPYQKRSMKDRKNKPPPFPEPSVSGVSFDKMPLYLREIEKEYTVIGKKK